MNFLAKTVDVVVVGAGHAGCEAVEGRVAGGAGDLPDRICAAWAPEVASSIGRLHLLVQQSLNNARCASFIGERPVAVCCAAVRAFL